MPDEPDQRPVSKPLSRRTLIGSGSLLLGGIVAGCSGPGQRLLTDGDIDAPERTPQPPQNLEQGYQFFGAEEAVVLAALVDRLIPGDETDPGALQA
ncbi:MAG TPA: hypothetical protein VK045_02740, partial [Ornithinicoccus sp.]|nr:hypothetical protein [Ornithinicoccus sp.]